MSLLTNKVFKRIQYSGKACIYIYAGEYDDGRFIAKIGMTKNPAVRIRALNSGMPFDAIMKWSICSDWNTTRAVESDIHRQVADRRTRGEWFIFNANHKAWLNACIEKSFSDLAGVKPFWQYISDEHSGEGPQPGADYGVNTFHGNGESSRHECKYCGAPKDSGRGYCDENCKEMDRVFIS